MHQLADTSSRLSWAPCCCHHVTTSGHFSQTKWRVVWYLDAMWSSELSGKLPCLFGYVHIVGEYQSAVKLCHRCQIQSCHCSAAEPTQLSLSAEAQSWMDMVQVPISKGGGMPLLKSNYKSDAVVDHNIVRNALFICLSYSWSIKPVKYSFVALTSSSFLSWPPYSLQWTCPYAPQCTCQLLAHKLMPHFPRNRAPGVLRSGLVMFLCYFVLI